MNGYRGLPANTKDVNINHFDYNTKNLTYVPVNTITKNNASTRIYLGSDGNYYKKDGDNYNKIATKTLATDYKFPTSITYRIGDKSYGVYKDTNNNYYYLDGATLTKVDNEIDLRAMQNARANTSTLVTNNSSQAKPTNRNTNTNTNLDVDTSTKTINVGEGYNPYKDLYDALKEDFDARNKRLDEVEAQLAELTRPKTAREIAEELSIDYDEQNLLNMYNEDTNTFYDDMIKAQNETRDQYLRNNSQYVNQLARNYLDSYRYAAPTAVGKAALAANVLASNLYASQDNSANDTGMLQSVNALEEARRAELAMNPYTAKDYYTQMGKALANASATRNYSDVMQYQQKSNALAQIDAANRALNQYNAQAAATKYSGLASAQGTTASSSGNDSYLRQLYNTIYAGNNGNKTKTARAMYGILTGAGTK